MNYRNILMTIKDIIKGNLFQLIILTWGLTYVLINIANNWLTHRANINNEYMFTRNVELVGSIQFVFVVLAALLSLVIIIGLHYLNRIFLQSKVAKKLGLSKYLNKPVSWKTSFILPLKITNVLFYIMKKIFYSILFLIKWIYKIVAFTISIIYLLIGPNDRNRFSGRRITEVYNSTFSNSNNSKKAKSDAEWVAKQKKKEADYAWKYAKKQADYNPNTTHFKNRLDRANSFQREANEAEKKAKKL